MYLVSRLLNPRSLAFLAPVALSLLLCPAKAQAQTWVGNRAGPGLTEILTIDATGEPNWPWGSEDVAGDGLNNFTPAEQAIDARTVYVATDATHFYSRVYFSVANAQPGNISTFVFIDTDQNPVTGGSATGNELDASFTSDPSSGGYEYVIKIQRTAESTTTATIFQFDNTARIYTAIATQPGQVVAETNFYLDPIRVNQLVHGYLQSSVDLALVGLTQACQANLFVRSTNQTTGLGAGDLVVGAEEACVPTLNNNNVPVVVVPPVGCTSNAECPYDGVCVNGDCVLTLPCAVNADCAAGYVCNTGRCVFISGAPCIDSSNCDGLVCQQGLCAACPNDAACGAGFVCGPDGRCLLAGNGTIPCTNSSTCDGFLCQAGQCVVCPSNAACGTGYVCDAAGRCVAGIGAPCTNSNTCNGLVCQAGQCVDCVGDAACGTGYSCGADGRCVAGIGAPCTNSDTCNGYLCQAGQCVVCTNDAACGTGFVCGADGRCVAGSTSTTVPSDAGQLSLQNGERLQGGACACRAGTSHAKAYLGLFSLLGLSILLRRNTKREREP